MIISKPDDQGSEVASPPSSDLQTDPLRDAALAERCGFLFAKLHHRFATESAAALREAGLDLAGLHFGGLSLLEAAGPMSQQELGEALRKDRTSIVALVDELEEHGLVERRRNPADRRAYALEVTAAGREWLRRAGPAMIGAEDELLEPLNEEERVVLVDLLQRMLFAPPPG
jgi:DNA-binding MarR family transcriptional regulator